MVFIWLKSGTVALCVRRLSINRQQKAVLAGQNGNCSVIHVQIYIKRTVFLESSIHRCIVAMLSLLHDKGLVLRNLPFHS